MMEPSDIQFLQIDGYSLILNRSITKFRERVVRFLEDGTPDWVDLLRVCDCVLFEFEVTEFYPFEKAARDKDGYWVPYKFIHPSYGPCIVRAYFRRN